MCLLFLHPKKSSFTNTRLFKSFYVQLEMYWYYFPLGRIFACFVWFFVSFENFSLIRRRHHYRLRAANLDLCSALMAIEQWRFLAVTPTVTRGTGPFIMVISEDQWNTSITERLEVELSLPVYWLRSVAAGIRTPNLPLSRRTLYPLHHRRGFWKNDWMIHSSDKTRLAPPTLVTRCYVPHYGDISIKFPRYKVMKIMKMFTCEW